MFLKVRRGEGLLFLEIFGPVDHSLVVVLFASRRPSLVKCSADILLL